MSSTNRVPRAERRTEIAEDECWELLQARTVGRVGFTQSGLVKIIPVNYVLDGHAVIIRTSPTGMLASIPSCDGVAFEVDYHNSSTGAGWNVLMNGSVAVMSERQVADLHLGHRVVPWAGGDRSLHLRFEPGSIEGRRVLRRR